MQNDKTMSKVYTSGRMEALCGKLAENLTGNQVNVFIKSMIITQSGGMNVWLTANLANANGIFANFEFQNQDGFMGQVYELLTGQKLRSNGDAIKFGVYRLLNTAAFKSQFADVARYYENNDLRRIQLAEKIADLFDQYQLYREKMIESWEAGKTSTEKPESENWQMWLWRELNLSSKATLRDEIYQKLKSGENQELLKRNWPEIHLFGISIITHFHKEFYEKIGEYITVRHYHCLPVSETMFNNSLLESFGAKARELLEAFAGMNNEPVDSTNHFPKTLLGRLQESIRNNRELTDKGHDNSIQVCSHFTPVREVEALYNFLLDLFEKDRAIKSRDILIITPDINKYEPFIKAVFRNAPVRLPIQVSGVATTTGDSITASLELLVGMGEEDMTAEKVMGLFEQNRIRKAYQIEDTGYIRAVVSKAGIRFGWENRLEDDSHFVSWKYGLEKIILGYAMNTEEAFDVSHRLTEDEKEYLGEEGLTNYPYKDAEASASHDLLRLKAFVDDLQELFDAQQIPRKITDWKLLFIEKIMGEMVWSNDFDKNDREERAEIFRALAFTEGLPEALADEEVPWDVFVNELKKRLFTESRENELNTGAITFTSAIPARGLPYKIISFIGLDNGVFPRQDRHLGFDLMGNDYQPGDRSKKEADKSLFLDTLMAAREKLYLSYIGQSVKDNTEIPPSIVLDTLMDYLGLEAAKHPLHGFSKRYDDKKLFTYLYNSQADPAVFETKEKGLEIEGAIEEIWINDFVKFFEAPIDYYFKKVLGINYERDKDNTLPETELFDLNYLQKWEIKNDLLKLEDTSEEALNAFIQRHIKQGKLPLKNLGRAKVKEMWNQIEPLKTRYHELTTGMREESAAIDLTIDEIRITGTIDGIFGEEYIHVSTSNPKDVGKMPKKYKVRTYLHALLLFASGKINTAKLLALQNGKNQVELFEEDYPAVDAAKATEVLADLVKYLVKGKMKPLVFSLDALKPDNNSENISIQSVITALKAEAEGNSFAFRPPNKYLLSLFETGYFENICQEDVDQINEIARLLNLSQPNNEEV